MSDEQQKYVYLVAHKVDDNKPQTWFRTTAVAAATDVENMLRDFGGVAIVQEIEARDVAHALLPDFFTVEKE